MRLWHHQTFRWRCEETPHRIHRSPKLLSLDMTQYKMEKGKRLGSVLVKQFNRAQPGWGLGRCRAHASDVSDAVFRRTLPMGIVIAEAPVKLSGTDD